MFKSVFNKTSFIPLILFFLVSISMLTGASNSLDLNIYMHISKSITPTNTYIFKFITDCGSEFVVIGICLILFLMPKLRWKYGLPTAIAEACAVSFHQIFKMIFQRPRPHYTTKLIIEPGYSFPSGHATCNATLYFLLAYIGYRCIKNPYIKTLFCSVSIIMPFLISYSRVYLGVHYFTDVVGGLLLGTWFAILCINYIKEKERSKKNKICN